MAALRAWTAACDLFRNQRYIRIFKKPIFTSSKCESIYEDKALSAEPDVPDVPQFTLRLRGYDFVVLELFGKYVHNFLVRWNCDTEYYAVPSRSWSVKTYLPKSAVVDQQFDITKYERAIRVDGIPAPKYPILLDVLQQQMPAGIELEIAETNEEDDEMLYIPDKELQSLHGQLQSMAKAKEDAKKKK